MSDDAGLSRREFLLGTAAAGAAGAAGATGSAAAQETGTGTGGGATGTGGGATGTGGAATGTGGASGGQTVQKTVKVGPGGKLTFEPETVKVTPGSTVTWKWESDDHNVVPEKIPKGASWKGSPGGESKTYNTGYTYKFTFQKTGTYDYFCAPHKSAGMVGSVEVVESLSTPGGGGGEQVPTVPNSAKTLGVATVVSMVATLGLAYFFVKYGGDYEAP